MDLKQIPVSLTYRIEKNLVELKWEIALTTDFQSYKPTIPSNAIYKSCSIEAFKIGEKTLKCPTCMKETSVLPKFVGFNYDDIMEKPGYTINICLVIIIPSFISVASQDESLIFKIPSLEHRKTDAVLFVNNTGWKHAVSVSNNKFLPIATSVDSFYFKFHVESHILSQYQVNSHTEEKIQADVLVRLSESGKFSENFLITFVLVGVWSIEIHEALRLFILSLPRDASFTFCIFTDKDTYEYFPSEKAVQKATLEMPLGELMESVESRCIWKQSSGDTVSEQVLTRVLLNEFVGVGFRDTLVIGDVSSVNTKHLSFVQTLYTKYRRGRLSFVQLDNFSYQLYNSSVENQCFIQKPQDIESENLANELLEFFNDQCYYLFHFAAVSQEILIAPISNYIRPRETFRSFVIANKKSIRDLPHMPVIFVFSNIYNSEDTTEFETIVDLKSKNTNENIFKLVATENIADMEHRISLISHFNPTELEKLKVSQECVSFFNTHVFKHFQDLEAKSEKSQIEFMKRKGWKTESTNYAAVTRIDQGKLKEIAIFPECNHEQKPNLKITCSKFELPESFSFITESYSLNPAILLKYKEVVLKYGSEKMKQFAFDPKNYKDESLFENWRFILSIGFLLTFQKHSQFHPLLYKLLRFVRNVNPKLPVHVWAEILGKLEITTLIEQLGTEYQVDILATKAVLSEIELINNE